MLRRQEDCEFKASLVYVRYYLKRQKKVRENRRFNTHTQVESKKLLPQVVL